MQHQGKIEQNDAQFTEVTKDPASARLLRKALEEIARSGSNPVAREMAQEVLSGRISLRKAGEVSAYAEAVGEQARPFKERWESLSTTERESLAAEGEKIILGESDRDQSEEISDRRTHTSRHSSGPTHNSRGWSLY